MRTTTVPCSNSVVGGGVFDPGPGAPAGTWDDDSDATWALGDSATRLPKVPTVTRNASLAVVTAHVRYVGDAPDAYVAEDHLGGFPVLTRVAMPGGTVATPTWTSVEMTGDMSHFLRSLYSDAVATVFLLFLGNDSNRYYEAHMTVQGPGSTAPPCRLYPGGIQGTVGGAVRQFPPQKYRQATGRGPGCY